MSHESSPAGKLLPTIKLPRALQIRDLVVEHQRCPDELCPHLECAVMDLLVQLHSFSLAVGNFHECMTAASEAPIVKGGGLAAEGAALAFKILEELGSDIGLWDAT